jgi:hypothetical protein
MELILAELLVLVQSQAFHFRLADPIQYLPRLGSVEPPE